MFQALLPSTADADLQARRGDLHAVDAKIANLARAIESAPDLDPLIAQMRERQKERQELFAAVVAAETRQNLVLDHRRVEETVLADVAQWRTFLTTEPDVRGARQFLRELLEGPLTFTPDGKAYQFEGAASPDRLFGQVGLPPCVASPTGKNDMYGRVRVRLRRAA